MLRLAYTAIKYFAIGLLIGLFTAPRSGTESRRLLRDKGMSAVKDILPSSLGGGSKKAA
ncbi:MAG: YtxH domain-containing protein [Dehalococcoidales bacterium]|nr:YtxH domain-containing protein [Dehalococcoidales bacterium]